MKKTICIARLRSRVKYTEPLMHILDYWYDLIREYVAKNSDRYDFTFYNVSLDGKTPKRDLEAIRKADIIVIPSEAEFQYHIPGYIHTLDKKASDEHVAAVYEIIKYTSKEILILQSDRKDSRELYQTYTFPGMTNKIWVIDDMDFIGTIQSCKYWYMKKYIANHYMYETLTKKYDFCYYGCDKTKDVGGVKSNDLRMNIMKLSKKDADLKCFFIGRYTNFKPDMKFTYDMKDIIPYLYQSNATVCFNWPGFNKQPTTRYAEALAAQMIPLVWHTYDEDNSVVVDQWQRCNDYEDFKGKLIQLRDEGFRKEKYNHIVTEYEKYKILSLEDYYKAAHNKFDFIF